MPLTSDDYRFSKQLVEYLEKGQYQKPCPICSNGKAPHKPNSIITQHRPSKQPRRIFENILVCEKCQTVNYFRNKAGPWKKK